MVVVWLWRCVRVKGVVRALVEGEIIFLVYVFRSAAGPRVGPVWG